MKKKKKYFKKKIDYIKLMPFLIFGFILILTIGYSSFFIINYINLKVYQ